MYGRVLQAISALRSMSHWSSIVNNFKENPRPQECKICLENFNTRERRPRSLPCGHTFCTHCIRDLIKNMRISCPHCRTKHVLKQATELPISYIVEEFMARDKYSGEQKSTPNTICQNAESNYSRREYQSNDHNVEWTVRSLSGSVGVAVTKNSSCCGHAFRRMYRSIPTCLRLTRGPWRRGTSSVATELGVHRLSRIYAVRDEDDRRRSAIMTLHEGRMYLHALKNQPAPSTRTLKHSDVVALLDSESTTAFLDLAWSGMVRGRVLIQLYTSTTSGQIFLQLCTGEKGPNYEGTTFLEVHYKDKPGEYVLVGGSFDSEEVHKLMSNPGEMNDIMCQTTGRAGLVWGRTSTDAAGFGQFAITTREPGKSVTYMQVLGKVVRGLEIVSAAAQHSDLTEVKIVDCGVLVPF